jgi:hypothetical protein
VHSCYYLTQYLEVYSNEVVEPGQKEIKGLEVSVIVVDFLILFQPFTAQLSTFSSFLIPLSSHESLKTIMNQQ